jgi:hypothetical protein
VNTLPTSDKGPKGLSRVELEAAFARNLGPINRGLPFGQYEFVDVTFNSTANGDTEVKHSLVISDPEAVRVIPVTWSFASTPLESPYIWRNSASTRRPWGQGYIILRCNLASAQARILLVAEAQ